MSAKPKTVTHYTLDRITQTFLSPHALWFMPTRKDDELGTKYGTRVVQIHCGKEIK